MLVLGNLFSGFVPNLESIFRANRNNSEMRDNRFKLAIVLKPRQIFDQIELEPGRLWDIRVNWIALILSHSFSRAKLANACYHYSQK
jgi:hypothetical protein